MLENEPDLSDYGLFAPVSGANIFNDYPELRKHEEIRELSAQELLFVWYFACESSPAVKNFNDPNARARFAYKKAFPGQSGGEQKGRWEALKFPEKISNAIEKMKTFKPGVRLRGLSMINKIMNNYEKIIDVDVDGNKEFLNKDSEVDWSKKKAYVDSCAKIVDVLPGLIEQAESGFGMRKKSSLIESEELGEGSLIDSYANDK